MSESRIDRQILVLVLAFNLSLCSFLLLLCIRPQYQIEVGGIHLDVGEVRDLESLKCGLRELNLLENGKWS